MGIWQAGAAGLLFLQLLIASAFPDLQNPDFGIPPTNPFIALNSTIKSILGWSYQGTVKYVILSSSSEEGNPIYLGENGKVNQTFKENKESHHYLLTFNLRPAQPHCANPTSVTVSVPDKSVVVTFNEKFTGNQSSWQTHGVSLGIHGNGELVNLNLESQASRQTSNTTVVTKCGVLLDSFILKNISNPINSSGDYLSQQMCGDEFLIYIDSSSELFQKLLQMLHRW
ncbi:uncharacterized protein LOC113309885 [Papaver somniferum]|uniref:uncharacterized protein LOC113309885 n=1 Tax=Papaver somniferum TaxID=3469 RepID=UPI000E6FD3DD|nr:uncharacterized protein LOC113309885 [Papaver somniferum]